MLSPPLRSPDTVFAANDPGIAIAVAGVKQIRDERLGGFLVRVFLAAPRNGSKESV